MSKHHASAARPSPAAVDPNPQRNVAASRRRTFYALAGLSAAAIAVAIFAARPTPSRTSEPAAPSSARAAESNLVQLQTAAAATAPLMALRSFHDFGTISMAAGNVSHRYAIRNVGSAPLTLTRLSTSCMCTVATLTTASGRMRGPFGMPGHGAIPTFSERLAPGEAAQVEVVFDPAAHGPAGVGRISRTVTLENDAGAPLQVSFAAQVTP